MVSLLLAIFGAFAVLAACWLAGRATAPHSAPTLSFGIGAVLVSYAMFGLMCTGSASNGAMALVLGFASAAGLLRGAKMQFRPPPALWLVAFVPFGFWYLVNSLAPEVQTDPNTYHLKPAVDSLRFGGFAQTISFYDRLPQGFEMLFIPAWRIGGSSAAKLVHFGFLLATLPVILRLARIWNLPEHAGYGAAALYFCTPVVGFAGSAAFNDAALVYFTLTAIAFALEGRPGPAGLLAGFCYAIKMTGLLAVPVVIGIFLLRKQWQRGTYVALAAALTCLPWVLRNWTEAGNPFAPFLNAWFPNPYFYVWTEQNLTRSLRDYGVPLWQRVPEVLAGSRLHGILGPAFVLAPLALLAARTRSTWKLLLLAAVFSVPWFMNAGARFTMTMLPFLALAMFATVQRRMVLALVSLHAFTSWPAIIALYSPNSLRLREFPWQAALRIQTEEEYLSRRHDYQYVRMVDLATPPDARILDLWGAHAVHSSREFVGGWHSAEAVRLVDALEFARQQAPSSLVTLTATFQRAAVCGVRVVLQASSVHPAAVHAMEVRLSGQRITTVGDRFVSSSKMPWEIKLALDTNPVSRWWTGEPASRGDYTQLEYERPVMADSVHMLIPAAPPPATFGIEVCREGNWSGLSTDTGTAPRLDLRPPAVAMLKQAGITHILTPVAFVGIGALGERLVNEADDWGMEVVENLHAVYLLKVR